MRVTKISLATLLALGTLTCANATTSLEEAIKGTTIGGYALGQFTSMFGDDASGSAYRSRVWMNVNTGSISGFSVGTRVFASMGQGAPNGGSFIENSGNPAGTAAFGMYALYGKYSFEALGSKTTMIGGKMNIMTPFNDNAWDYGYGLYISNEDIEGVKLSAQAYALWSLDNTGPSTKLPDYNNPVIDPTTGSTQPGSKSVSQAISSTDKPLYIFGVEGDKEKFSGAGFKIYAGHSTSLINYFIGADVSYTFSGVTLQSQVAVMDVDTSNDSFANFASDEVTDLAAKMRGLYNIQLSYANKDVGFSAKAGFTGSFGDGYGALLNYASFNMGGQFWYDTVSSFNGYGLTGNGGYKYQNPITGAVESPNIMVGYVGIQYTGVQSLSLGLDYAYVGGDNHYATMAKYRAKTKAQGNEVTNMNATFHEVSFTASYAFIPKKLTLSGIVGSTFGDLQMGRARAVLKYTF